MCSNAGAGRNSQLPVIADLGQLELVADDLADLRHLEASARAAGFSIHRHAAADSLAGLKLGKRKHGFNGEAALPDTFTPISGHISALAH